MEKLIIKNFGPIKDAEIELKKVNIFIGPRGSGKSAIIKIISAIRSTDNWPLGYAYWQDLKSKLEIDFNLASFFEKDTFINVETGDGSKMILEAYEKSIVAEPASAFIESVYIPAERTIFPLIAESSYLFLHKQDSIAKYIAEFGVLFQNARANFKSQKIEIFEDAAYSFENSTDTIILKNGKKILLSESSNGIKTTLPLLLAINQVISGANKTSYGYCGANISMEEPELSLFPSAQNELLKFILGKVIPQRNIYLNITTHSPYTLTSVNNLIYAYQVGQKNEAVKNIMPENLWLNPDDIGAWFVSDGTVRSIIDIENGEIKAEEIDIISDHLNQEYDKIMDIEFAETK